MKAQAESRYELGMLALAKNKLEDALKYSNEAIGMDSSKCKFYCQRVQCFVQLKKYSLALDDCKSVKILDQKYQEICPWEFECHMKLGDFAAAKIALDKLKRLNSIHDKLEAMQSKYDELTQMEKLVREAAKNNNIKSVQDKIDKLVQECDGSKKIYGLMVECLLTAKDFEKAQEVFLKELDCCMNDPDILYVRAAISFHKGDLPNSNSALQALFKLAPDFDEKGKTLYTKVKGILSHIEIGSNAFRQKDYEKAKVSYTAALELSTSSQPLQERFLVNRAVVNIKLQKFEEVVRDCTLAIQLNDTLAKAFFNRAEGYAGLDKLTEAKEDFEKVYALDKNEIARRRADEMVPKSNFNFSDFIDQIKLEEQADYDRNNRRPPQEQEIPKKPLDEKQLKEFRDAKARMRAAGDDAYRVLGIKQGDDYNTARRTINKLKKKYHPDAHATYPELKAECDEIFKMIIKANSEYEMRRKFRGK